MNLNERKMAALSIIIFSFTVLYATTAHYIHRKLQVSPELLWGGYFALMLTVGIFLWIKKGDAE